MKIFLIGLPGSGKTTFGKSLAEKLNSPFIDLDSEIERLEGRPVQEIFSNKTENYFRTVESTVIKEFCVETKSFVMATVGGAPCFFDNMDAMNRSGKTIFLNPPVKEIVDRLMHTDLSERPLFADVGADQLENRINSLRAHRMIFLRAGLVHGLFNLTELRRSNPFYYRL